MLISPRVNVKGFTVIEIAIGLVIIAILFAAGMPSLTLWIQNTKIRAGAESILDGLQLAKGEAISRNANVRFNLTSTNGKINWQVGCVTPIADLNGDGVDDCPAIIRQYASTDTGANTPFAGVSTANPIPAYTTTLTPGSNLPAGITFNFLGQNPVANAGADITRIDVSNPNAAQSRRMVIVIGAGGITFMCDPALTKNVNAQGCS